MKIHIVQRNDTFETIANKYGVSVQDLIGMNTHINHLAGLVPGLKVKVPDANRKEEANVAQHIQKYYPNLDMNPVELKTASTVEPTKAHKPAEVHKPIEVETEAVEEVMPIPLKPLPGETVKPTHPNDGVKVKFEHKGIDVKAKATAKVTVNKETIAKKEPVIIFNEKESIEKTPIYEEYQPAIDMPQYPSWGMPEQGWAMPEQGWAMPEHGFNPGFETAPFYSGCGNMIPPSYYHPMMHHGCCQPMHPACPPYELPPSYELMRSDERFFFGGPSWGWGYPPFWGWGWGGPFWGWGGHHGGGHHRSPQEVQPYQPRQSTSSCSSLF